VGRPLKQFNPKHKAQAEGTSLKEAHHFSHLSFGLSGSLKVILQRKLHDARIVDGLGEGA
jgi:hypothetical protein